MASSYTVCTRIGSPTCLINPELGFVGRSAIINNSNCAELMLTIRLVSEELISSLKPFPEGCELRFGGVKAQGDTEIEFAVPKCACARVDIHGAENSDANNCAEDKRKFV